MACSRLRRGRALRWLVLGVSLAVGLAGCSTGSEAAAPEAAVSTAAPPVRTVPEPVGGALRVDVPAPDEPRPADLEHEVLLYGDSVALLVADDLAAELDSPLVVDAVDCRRLDRGFTGPCGGVPDDVDVASGVAGLTPAAAMLDEPTTATAVVVIANNAAVAASDLEDAMAALGALPRVWWVTARVDGRGWQDPNNQLLADLAARDPRAGVIDWFRASDEQGWLVDNVHPSDEGQAAMADLIAAHVRCDCTP